MHENSCSAIRITHNISRTNYIIKLLIEYISRYDDPRINSSRLFVPVIDTLCRIVTYPIICCSGSYNTIYAIPSG